MKSEDSERPGIFWMKVTAASGGLAVVLGAFGAHGLKPVLSSEALTWFETANRYHFYHTLALLGIVALMTSFKGHRWLGYAAVAFFAGIILFSGSLYLMALTGWKFLGPVTPLGGLAFATGWILMLIAGVRSS